jgi:hypothetical protein
MIKNRVFTLPIPLKHPVLNNVFIFILLLIHKILLSELILSNS